MVPLCVVKQKNHLSLQLLQFFFDPAQIVLDGFLEEGQVGAQQSYFPPKRLDYITDKPQLVLVDIFGLSEHQHLCDFQPPLLFHLNYLCELADEEGIPIHVVLKLRAAVADIAGVEYLLHKNLNRRGSTHLCSLFCLGLNCLVFQASWKLDRFLLWKLISVLRISLVTIFFAFNLSTEPSRKLHCGWFSIMLHRCAICMFYSTD